MTSSVPLRRTVKQAKVLSGDDDEDEEVSKSRPVVPVVRPSAKARATVGPTSSGKLPPVVRTASRSWNKKGTRKSMHKEDSASVAPIAKGRLPEDTPKRKTIELDDRMEDLNVHGDLENELLLEDWMYELRIFRDCSRAFVERVLEGHKRIVFQPGENIVCEGDQGHSMYMVHFGFADVVVAEQEVGAVSKGDCIGEMMLLGVAQQRTATVRARSVCGVIEVREEIFSAALKEFPDEREAFLLEAEGRQDALNKQREQMLKYCVSFQDCSERFLHLIAGRLEQQLFFPGENICVEHKPQENLHILLHGIAVTKIGGRDVRVHMINCEISNHAGDSRPVTPHVMGNCAIVENASVAVFGELNVLGIEDCGNTTVNVQNVCDVRILTRANLLRTMKECPEDAEMISQRISSSYPSPPRLDQVKTFESCSLHFLGYLKEHLENRFCFRGQMLTTEGQDGKSLVTVSFGAVEAFVEGIHYANLPCGQLFGNLNNLSIYTQKISDVKTQSMAFLQVLHQSLILKALGDFPGDRTRILEVTRTDHEERALNALRTASLFQGTPPEVVEMIAGDAEQQVFLPGDTLIQEGSAGETMFVLVEGIVCVSVLPPMLRADVEESGGKEGTQKLNSSRRTMRGSLIKNALPGGIDQSQQSRELMLKQIGPGATFGEMAAIGVSKIRLATIRASSLSIVWVIQSETVMKMVNRYPFERVKFAKLVNSNLERSVAKRVSGLSLLENFDKKFAVVLGLHCERRVFFPGQVVVRENRVGDNLIVVNSGVVSLEMCGESITTLQPGSMFGGTVLLGLEKLYFATLHAKTVCQVLMISKGCLSYAVEKYPETKSHLGRVKTKVSDQTERLKNMYRKIVARKRLMRRMCFSGNPPDAQHMAGGDEEEDEHRDSSSALLKCIVDAWQEHAKLRADLARQRADEFERSTRRMKEWLTWREEAMSKIKPVTELKALISHNLNSRGPLERRLPALKESSKPILEKSPSAKEVLEDASWWPKPRNSPHYKLKLWGLLKRLPQDFGREVLSRQTNLSPLTAGVDSPVGMTPSSTFTQFSTTMPEFRPGQPLLPISNHEADESVIRVMPGQALREEDDSSVGSELKFTELT